MNKNRREAAVARLFYGDPPNDTWISRTSSRLQAVRAAVRGRRRSSAHRRRERRRRRRALRVHRGERARRRSHRLPARR